MAQRVRKGAPGKKHKGGPPKFLLMVESGALAWSISFATTDTFLRVNGHYLEVEAFAAHKFITESIGQREFRIRQIRERLSAYVRPL